MKYIRTEDRIYEVEKKGIGKVYYCKGFLGKTRIVQEFNVIAEANTIEELCDEFVVEFEGYVPFTSDIFYIDEKHRKDELKPLAEHYKGYKNIYGAIWTSKGLIYVAKMDSEGKLVLI